MRTFELGTAIYQIICILIIVGIPVLIFKLVVNGRKNKELEKRIEDLEKRRS